MLDEVCFSPKGTVTINTALITGALGGIGQALCREFRSAGYFVIATDMREGENVSDAFLQFDVRDFYANAAARGFIKRLKA